jgi:protein associated with RNAse G/E
MGERFGGWGGKAPTWTGPGRHLGWYVNLQCPYRRTPLGIEAMDLMLDIVVEPDMTWRWKDDDEFDEIV